MNIPQPTQQQLTPIQALNFIYNFGRQVVTNCEAHDNFKNACEFLAKFIEENTKNKKPQSQSENQSKVETNLK